MTAKAAPPGSTAQGPIADAWREAREAAARERAARERERKKAEQAAARQKHLADLAMRQEQAWRDVQRLIASKQQNAYDQAVTTLADLRELSVRADALDRFAAAVTRLREEHRGKHTLVQRLRKSGLLEEWPPFGNDMKSVSESRVGAPHPRETLIDLFNSN